MIGFTSKRYVAHSIHNIMREFYNLKQGKYRSNQDYFDDFNAIVTAIKEAGGIVGAHTATYDVVMLKRGNPANRNQQVTAWNDARE